MKHGKTPTFQQWKFMKEHDLDPALWLVSKDTPKYMFLVHRFNKETKTINKEK